MGLLEKDKRKFRVIIGSKKCGMCYGTSPSLAAKKVKEKSGAFYLKEITKDSKKKLYGPYSSKKGVVQRGGEFKENKIREQICEDILGILRNCNNLEILTETQKVYNRTYNVLENSYLFLDISDRTNKCSCLRSIIGTRDGYRIEDGSHFPLGYCLCYLKLKEQKAIEQGCFGSIGEILSQYSMSYSKNKIKYYENHWIKFIEVVLRRTIDMIELEIRERERKSNATLARLKKELEEEREKENNELFAKLKNEIEKAKTFHAAQEAGPAKNSNNSNIGKHNINPNGSSAANLQTNLSKIPKHMLQPVGRQRNVKQNQPSHNNEAEKQRLHENLLKRLEKLAKNNNNNLDAAIRQADINRNKLLEKFAKMNKD